MSNVLLELYHAGCRVNSEFYLRNVNLKLEIGKAVAIMGKNASGKSTLFSMLMGLFPCDSGEIIISDTHVILSSPQAATAQGILLLGQNQPMFDNMKLYENIYFGQELTKGKMLDNARMCKETDVLLKKLGLTINSMTPMRELGYAQKQLVSLARAVCTGAKLILMDEPSTHLEEEDKKILWNAINSMKSDGKTFLLITHDPSEALAIADYVMFMEQGILSEAQAITELSEESIIQNAYDILPGTLYARANCNIGEGICQVEGEISFTLQRGQITALLGDSNEAQLLLAHMAGLSPFKGNITVNGHHIDATPLSGIQNGISLALDENAESQLISARELLNNGAKGANANALFKLRQIGNGLSGAFGAWVGLGKKEEYITGGNRNRELVERALARRASIYLLLNPSAGMDIPARMRMYERFGEIAAEGSAILFTTGNTSEAIGLADRILVLRNNKIIRDIPASEYVTEDS